jgi:predicted PurR-regulated permease PerM
MEPRETHVELGGVGVGPRERRWLVAFLVSGTALFIVLLGQYALEVVATFSGVLLILFLAWLLAFVISPLVSAIENGSHVSRGFAAALVYALALIGLGFVLFYTGAAITQQLGELTRTFPQKAIDIEATLGSWQQSLQFGRLQVDLVQMFKTLQDQVGTIGSQLFDQIEAIAGVTVSALGSLVLILILSLYMVVDRDRILAKVNRIVPNRYKDEFFIFERSVARAFGGFLRAQLILAVVQAILVAVVGGIFGIPFLFLVATLSALVMLIPFFGPPLALIPPIVAALIYTGWFIPVTIILVGVQTVLVNWLQPKLMQGALGLHPLLVLIGLLVGSTVAGVWGALFGIPVIAVINVFINYLLFRAVPNAALPEVEQLSDVSEGTMVTIEKEQRFDDTHPHIRVHRSLRPDGSEQVDLEMSDEPPPVRPARSDGGEDPEKAPTGG